MFVICLANETFVFWKLVNSSLSFFFFFFPSRVCPVFCFGGCLAGHLLEVNSLELTDDGKPAVLDERLPLLGLMIPGSFPQG